MLTKVMDGGRVWPGTIEAALRRGLRAAGALLAAIALPALVVVASSPAHAEEFNARVLDLSKNFQRVTIPLNRSVTVETSIAVDVANVVTPTIANVQLLSPTRLLVTGQSFGSTTVVLTAGEGKQFVVEVTVELDLEPLNRSIHEIDPLATAKATSINGNIVLMGRVSSLERAKRIADLAKLFMPNAGDKEGVIQNHLEVAGEQQVQLRCVVAEVSRKASRELGVNGYLAGENFHDAFLVNNLGGINPVNIGAAAGALANDTIPFLTDQNGLNIQPTTTLTVGLPRVQGSVFIQAMADNNLLKVLAEPNLTAISGETATFLAGGEFPIPVPQGNQQVTIEFRQFGVRLNFTPIVRGGQLIRLRVAPEVSELDFTTAVQIQGYVVPGLTSRATETTVELGSGQTIAIAGLLSEEVRGAASRVPFLGDVPVLGSLFRSVNFQRSLTDLLVLVTPEIVAPLDPHQKPHVPGEDIESPNDFDLYALGLVETPDGKEPPANQDGNRLLASEPKEASVHGPWGHAGTGGR